MTTSSPDSVPPLSADVFKAATEAFLTLVDKTRSLSPVKPMAPPPQNQQPKTWFTDPFALLDSVGMGYRAAPTYLTFETMRQASERNDVIAAIHLTRINQVAAFCRPQRNKYSVGFEIRPRGLDKKRQLRQSEKDRIEEIQNLVLDTGREFNLGRDSFEQWMRKEVRDTLTYDQLTFEKVGTRSGSLHSFYAVPADTIRIAAPKITKGTPPSVAEAKREIKYVQLINSQKVTEYTIEEMAFGVRNPRTNVRVYGYGFSEIEQLITTVTSHLYAEEWNRRAFSQGSTVKGILNLQGQMPMAQFESFKRQWQAQVSGINNAWKTPVVNQEGVQWLPLQMNNVEMGYQMWMEYLIKIISAIYQIDPAEINFDLRGSSQQQPMFMSSNEAQQKVSKDRGLHPLLRFLEDLITKHIVWRVDPRFEFGFVGLDAKTEDQAMQLRMQEVQNVYTLNETRAKEDLPPLKNGDIVLNPTYTGYMMQKAQMDQQQQMMAGQGGPPGGAPPGADGQQMPGGPQQTIDPNQQPYGSRFGKKPPGDEEAKGANKLNDFLQRGGSEDDSSSEPADETEDSSSKKQAMNTSALHINDWDSTVRSSLQDEDLMKSLNLFDTLDV